MNWLKRLFHIHEWDYTPAVYINEVSERLGLPHTPASRACNKCTTIEQQSVICLGLNPPEYIKQWETVKR